MLSRQSWIFINLGGALVMSESEYDLVVIGTGPAGQKGAIAAAKARWRVAVIDRTDMIGGVSVHTREYV
jgi:succinate dehydrogenase/fumarate reductase flavoprotein subunit